MKEDPRKDASLIDMTNVVFAFRPDEAITVSDERPASPRGLVVGVALLDTPAFPGPREKMWRNDTPAPFAVIACYHYRHLDGWGFLGLDVATKQAIGDMLVSRNAERGRWYWIDVHSNRPSLEHKGIIDALCKCATLANEPRAYGDVNLRDQLAAIENVAKSALNLVSRD